MSHGCITGFPDKCLRRMLPTRQWAHRAPRIETGLDCGMQICSHTAFGLIIAPWYTGGYIDSFAIVNLQRLKEPPDSCKCLK